MFRLFLLLVIFISNLNGVLAQSSLQWVGAICGVGRDRAYDVTVDHEGNMIAAGYISDTADMDPGPAVHMKYAFNQGTWGRAAFVSKMDSNGNFLWAHVFNLVQVTAVDVDKYGGIYITGFFAGSVDFDPGPGVAIPKEFGNGDIYLAKYDKNGNFVWVESFGSNFHTYEYPNHLKVRNDHIYLTGWFHQTVDFEPGLGKTELTAGGCGNVFILKMDLNRKLKWARHLYSKGCTNIYGLNFDKSGNFIFCGQFRDTTDFDPGPGKHIEYAHSPGNGAQNEFLWKLDSNANFIWVKTFQEVAGSYKYGTFFDIDSDSDENIYTTGYFSRKYDFDPSPDTFILSTGYTHSGTDISVAKYTPSGDFVWAKSIGSFCNDHGWKVVVDEFDALYLSGSLCGKADVDPGTDSAMLDGWHDNYIAKWNKDGEFIWVGGYGGEKYHYISIDDLMILSDGRMVVAGEFQDTVDFDPDTGSAILISKPEHPDAFVLKQTLCAIDVRVSQNDNLLEAKAGNSIYQWLDCSNGNSPIKGANKKKFKALINGKYAVAVKQGNCIDTSACYLVTTLGMERSSRFDNLSIRPNPSQGVFTVTFDGSVNSQINVYNTQGKLVHSQLVTNSLSSEIELPRNLANGMYMVKYSGKDQEYSAPLMLQRD